jgi:hypothetical protein
MDDMKMYCSILGDICTGNRFSVCPECMEASSEYARKKAEEALRDLYADTAWTNSVKALCEVPA